MSDQPREHGQLQWTRLHYAIMALALGTLTIDVGEMALSGSLSAIFSSGDTKATAGELSWLLASVYVGGALGAWPVGRMADHLGRRNLIVAMLALLTVTSILAAFSKTVGALTLWRGVSGVALSVLPVLTIAYLTDVLPTPGRASRLMLMSGVAFSGSPIILSLLSVLQSMPSIGQDAWRWVLAFGGAIAALCCLLFTRVPESPQWLATRGRLVEASAAAERFRKSPVVKGQAHDGSVIATSRAPLPSEKYGHRLLFVCSLCVLAPIATIGFPILSGAILVERGFSLSASVMYVAVSSYGFLAGALVTTPLMDRVERSSLLALCAGVMAAGLSGFFLSQDEVLLTISGGAFMAASAVYMIALNIYAAELFPLRIRATTTSVAWGVLRVAALVGILLLVPALRERGTPVVLFTMLSCLLLTALVSLFFGPRSATQTRDVLVQQRT